MRSCEAPSFAQRSGLLSTHIRPLKAIRKEWLASESIGWTERFHRFLHRLHRLRASLLLATFVTGGSVLASFLVGWVVSRMWPYLLPIPDGSSLLTTAAALGSIAGLLFAALIFGMQFHGERLGHASFLVRYLARREGIVPIAAFTLSVIAGNLIVGLLAPQFLPQAAFVMALLDIGLIPAVCLLTLWLIYRLVAVISGDFFEQSLKPGLTWEYQRALDEEIHRSLLISTYNEILIEANLEYDSGLVWLNPNQSTVTFRLNRCGEIRDVNIEELRALGKLIGHICPNYTARLSVTPYDRVDEKPALFLTACCESSRSPRQGELVSESTKTQIDYLLQRIFVIKSAREREMIDLLARFHKTVITGLLQSYANANCALIRP